MLLHECVCGEPLLDDAPKCQRCGKSNPNHRQPRWRTFWPEVDTLGGADEAITLGYWAAFFAAGLGVVTSLVPVFGIGLAGLVDATLYAVCGIGIWFKWRAAAVLAFLLCLANIVFSIARGGGVGVLVFFIFVGLVNAMRGTFVRPRLSRALPPDPAG